MAGQDQDMRPSSFTDKFLLVVQKLSADKWFEKNQQALTEGFNEIIVNDDVIKQLTGEYGEALKAQLQETISANEQLQSAYNEAHGILLDTATKLVGPDELREQVPLTPEKLRYIVVSCFRSGMKIEDESSKLAQLKEWVNGQIKHLRVVGGGPMAHGRFEGSKDAYKEIKKKVDSIA